MSIVVVVVKLKNGKNTFYKNKLHFYYSCNVLFFTFVILLYIKIDFFDRDVDLNIS